MAQDRAAAVQVRKAVAETIAAVATPAGTGALGVLRLSGPRARAIALALLDVPNLAPRRATVAWARSAGETIDQVVATFLPGPNSPSGEDVVEFSAHGSPLILRFLLDACLAQGAVAALPGEFTQRAFLNGRLDLSQAEAVCELIRARTSGAHRACLRQLQGGLSRRLQEARVPILELLVQAEAVLDHPEEDIPALQGRETRRALEKTALPIEALAATFGRGRLLSEGARVCIVGRPNAGKSSLLNALLGRERAIVCPAPGTTRDTLEEACSLAGAPAVLIDTAGLREEACDPAEKAGMERARQALSSSDLALLVIDASRPVGPEDRAVHQDILSTAARQGSPVIPVLNKSDILGGGTTDDAIYVSALSGTGIDELLSEVSRKLMPRESAETEVILSARHHAALKACALELRTAETLLLSRSESFEDRLAHHLREALRRLDEIEGVGMPDEALHAVFSRFCVGK
jgi:tRNA modification GTPase